MKCGLTRERHEVRTDEGERREVGCDCDVSYGLNNTVPKMTGLNISRLVKTTVDVRFVLSWYIVMDIRLPSYASFKWHGVGDVPNLHIRSTLPHEAENQKMNLSIQIDGCAEICSFVMHMREIKIDTLQMWCWIRNLRIPWTNECICLEQFTPISSLEK